MIRAFRLKPSAVPHFDMPNYSMSAKDAEVLASAKMLLSHFKNTPLYEEASCIIDLLSRTVVKAQNPDYIDRIAVPSRPEVRYDRLVWDTLWNAVKQNKIIEFDYSGRWNQETSRRRVRPYQLLLDGGIFLFGYCEERQGERLFSIIRIKNLVITEDSFELPEDFQFESRCGGGKFGAFCTEEKSVFKIEFCDELRPLARGLVLADDEKIMEDDERGVTTVTFSSTQHYRIVEWMLSFGYRARPVSPDWFVDIWKEEVQWLWESVQEN